MAGTTQFPDALDAFPEIGPNTSEAAAGVEHDVVHENVHAAVAALQAKVGVNGSTNPASVDARLAAAEGVIDLLDGSSGVPYEVADGTTYSVPSGVQVLFTLPIELLGNAVLDVSGALVEVS